MSIEINKAALQGQLDQAWECYRRIEEILDPHVRDLKVVNSSTGRTQKDDGQWYTIGSGFWECEESPVGICVYHRMIDPAHDNCVFCHEPEERK